MAGRPLRRSQSRAEIIFAVYAEMGATRTLSALVQRLNALGVAISVASLKRYSARYGWQARAADVDAEAARRRQEEVLGAVGSMLTRHADLARAVQGAASSGLEKLLSSDARLAELKPSDIARLLEVGVKTERQAADESAERCDIRLAMANIVTRSLVDLFQDVNRDPEPEHRARLFAAGVDRLIGDFLTAAKP